MTPSQDTSLQELILASENTASSRIKDFTRLAAAVQLQRRKMKVSDTEQITRSTALWTLMELDGDIREALQSCGLDQNALRDVLKLRTVPSPSDVEAAPLHEDLARAVSDYLSELSDRRPIDLPDLAVAILRDGRDDSRGLLPGRLRALDVDFAAAIPVLERLVAPTSSRRSLVSDEDFSASVRGVLRDFGETTSVTASQIAGALQPAHPGYGGGNFEEVTLRPSEGATAPAADWLGRVRGLYDMTDVAKTRHRVIDGELTLLGLAELDASLAEDLRAGDFLDALRGDVECLPRRAAPDGTDVTAPAVVKAGYLTDAVLSDADVKDEIGVEADVDALARLIMDRDIQPPLSIGLFGDWGSGKSYFMRLMQQRVEQLRSNSARAGERSPGPYCTDVRQIAFNAWHYADDNLWASLLGRIFEGLGKPSAMSQIARDLVERGAAPPGGVLNYMGQRRRRAEELLSEGTEDRRLAQTRLEALEAATARSTPALRVLAAADVSDEPAIAAAKARVAESFGPQAAERARQADEASNILGRFAGDLQVLASLLHAGSGPRRRAAVLGGGILLALVLGLTVLAVVEPGWVKGLTAGLLSAATAVSLFARGARAAVSDEASAAAEQASAEADAERQDAEARIEVARAEIAALEAGGATGEYLANRAAEFRSRQGLVALIREELEQLGSALPTADGGAERVVLYIDDLDRCGTRRVVQVLEAVHLLLAFPLFVVVVGVDARWLLSSLQHHYRTQFSGGLAAATPQQYLEKIFQIPFAIPLIDPDGFRRLMGSMLPVEITPTESTRTDVDDNGLDERGADHPPGPPGPELAGDPTAETGDKDVGPPAHELDEEVIGEAVRVTRAELEFASALQPIVRSPRAAKRLVNLYRIIRTSAASTGRAKHVERDHRSILVLLALLVASPAHAFGVFTALRTGDDLTSFSTLIDRLRKPDNEPEEDDVLASLERLIEAEPRLDDLAPYRRWLSSVARFSFDAALYA